MKFLHTADWQIGMRAAHVGANAHEVRSARFTTAERVVTSAREKGADAILVTGDTFEDNAVQTIDVQRVSDITADCFTGLCFKARVTPHLFEGVKPSSSTHQAAFSLRTYAAISLRTMGESCLEISRVRLDVGWYTYQTRDSSMSSHSAFSVPLMG